MDPADQMLARKAATQFVEKTASPERMMAVVDFTGTTQVVQNFTADGEKLKRAAAKAKASALYSFTSEVASWGGLEGDFAAQTFLMAIRNLAKTLGTVPGRKTVVLFSEGFALAPQHMSELDAAIDACSQANVAIYPIDPRGLQVTFPGAASGSYLLDLPFPHEPGLLACLAAPPDPWPQKVGPGNGGPPGGGGGGGTGGGGGHGSAGGTGGGGGGTGGGGGHGSGGGTGGGGSGTGGGGGHGSGGGTGGGGGGTKGGSGGGSGYRSPVSNLSGTTYMLDRLNSLMNAFAGATDSQSVLYALARGTGGFPIVNTNDLLGGLNQIAHELDEYYILGYVPPSQAHDGSYHKITVKVIRKGVQLRYRNGYYDLKSRDTLAGKPEGKSLETMAASAQPGQVAVSLSAPYFYVSPGVARVNVALQVPASAIDFEKDKEELHSKVQVLGIASRADGSVAARFSETVDVKMEKKDLKEFSKGPFNYQHTFNVAPGKYTLKLVLSTGGKKFGKYETALDVAPFDGQHLELSGPALSDNVRPVDQLVASLDSQLLEDQAPLLFQGLEIFPQGGNHFQRGDKVSFYVEVFEPQLGLSRPPRGDALQYRRSQDQPAGVFFQDDTRGFLGARGKSLNPRGAHDPHGRPSGRRVQAGGRGPGLHGRGQPRTHRGLRSRMSVFSAFSAPCRRPPVDRF